MPGHKPQQTPLPPPAARPPRRPRPHGFARRRSAQPDAVVVHVLAQCQDCQTGMAGGWLKRRRQVMEVVLTPARVVEHQYWERQCGVCRQRWTPKVDLDGQAIVGQGRLGVDLLALIASLREQGRLPIATIQWYLQTFHQLGLSAGALVRALAQVAVRGQPAATHIWEQVRSSPVVHMDETGWRENGRNGYIWSVSTPDARCFQYGRRTKALMAGVGAGLCRGAGHRLLRRLRPLPGGAQRCWVHLLRDIHELKRQHPDDAGLGRWARLVHRLYRTATWLRGAGRAARERLERALLEVAAPFAQDRAAAQRVLSQRIVDYLQELFMFVEDRRVPSENNAAERSIRPLVTSRKTSGGTRGRRRAPPPK